MPVQQLMEKIADVNGVINDFIWVRIGIILLIGTGIFMSCRLHFFQLFHLKHWFKNTIGSLFVKNSASIKKTDSKSISQFQSMCTALAATIGTGNIAGVSAAIVLGGPGAVFWMWVAAFFGMLTSYSENVLGIYYRRKNEDGEWSGGAMYYLKDGLGRKKHCKKLGVVLATLFAVFTVFASFGIGNMGQVNKITLNIKSAFFDSFADKTVGGVSLISLAIGIFVMIITAIIVLGGLQRIANVAETVVPIMAVLYILGSLVLIGVHFNSIGQIFASIFKFAWGTKAVAGGAAGVALKEVFTQGCKRGMFSNEAGLGSSVMINSSSNVKEPAKQGMWGIFEVFFDTVVVCSMTAIVVLSSGQINLETGAANPGVNDATLVAQAFGSVFGKGGEIFVALAMFMFAFTTVLGWSQYGTKAIEYLFGCRATKVYRIIFVLAIVLGAVMTSSLAWDISDTFNGFMMIPNLIGVLALSPQVVKITQNYINRVIKGKKEKPLLSYDGLIQSIEESEK